MSTSDALPKIGTYFNRSFLAEPRMKREPCLPPASRQAQRIEYHGIRVTDPDGRVGLRNPERGLRTDTLIAEPYGAEVWGPSFHLRGKVPPGYADAWWILDAGRYEHFGLTLVQTYCYLDSFAKGPISDDKLALLEKSLNRLRERGMKALLRFAYERRMDRRGGATLERILQHLEQLRPLLRENADVIFVIQAGFVGAWGEWHNSTYRLEEDHGALADIVRAILEAVPEDRMIQVRVPKYKRWVLAESQLGGDHELQEGNAHTGSPLARIGFHDDGFLAEKTDGGTWPEPPHYAGPGNPEFDAMTKESPYVSVDGELFWADQGGKVDGLRAATRMRLHHYTSFSLAHSYSEREGRPLSIDDWMHTSLTLEDALRAGLPISDGYFSDGRGREVPRTFFEYIRDHLGYRLELQWASLPLRVDPGEALAVRVELINRGFSTLHNPRPVVLALIGADENPVEMPVEGVDPRNWQPYQPSDEDRRPLKHRIEVEASAPGDLTAGWYQAGLWLPDPSNRLRLDPRYAIRVANRDLPWWTDSRGRYGINILGTIRMS